MTTISWLLNFNCFSSVCFKIICGGLMSFLGSCIYLSIYINTYMYALMFLSKWRSYTTSICKRLLSCSKTSAGAFLNYSFILHLFVYLARRLHRILIHWSHFIDLTFFLASVWFLWGKWGRVQAKFTSRSANLSSQTCTISRTEQIHNYSSPFLSLFSFL